MPYEVECGECRKQILIQDLDVEVCCPYCQTTLILKAEDLSAGEELVNEMNLGEDSHVVTSEEASFEFNFSDSSSSVSANNGSSDSHLGGSGVSSAILDAPPPDSDQAAGSDDESEPDFQVEKTPGEDATLDSDEPETREDIPNYNFNDPPDATKDREQSESASTDTTEEEVLNFNFDDTGDDETTGVAGISIDTTAPLRNAASERESTADQTREKRKKKAGVDEDATPVAASVLARRSRIFEPPVVYSLISYAILVTLCLLYLLMKFSTARPHQLESLPDIAPPEEGEFRLIRENAVLAPGHTLKIGETQRFGNIRITPLKVTRAPLRFEYFQGNVFGGALPPTGPVMKLWLKIENISDDQVFPPLDMEMLTKRVQDEEDYDLVHAHNWVCRQEDLKKRTHRILMFNHPATSEYDIKGLITRPLKPGETMKTFLPTQEEDLGFLKGELVWRFQVRKGFNPRTMNGVTTLVEVEFSSDDVQSESS